MTAYAAATAIYGIVLHAGVEWVIAIGVTIHLLAIGLGLLAGPKIPRRAPETLVS